ncbi:hypothetical protein GJ496_010127 [Pomphorhynchus laevis]|nr:hypothetical protein GJ496_010127 [Pomphorhynchus laevis]
MMTAFLLLTGIIAFQISEQSSPNRHFQIVKPSQKCTNENEAKYWLSKDSECTICSCTDVGSFSCSSIECLMDLKCPEGQELVSEGCCAYCKSIKEDNVKHYCVLPQTNDMVSQNSIITRSWFGLNMHLCDVVVLCIRNDCNYFRNNMYVENDTSSQNLL